MRQYAVLSCGMLLGAFSGCSTDRSKPSEQIRTVPSQSDEVGIERAKLTPEDRALVDAQEWCVVSTDERLGAMGPPIKLDIKGQVVFVCCRGCKRKAESDLDKTLNTLAELKAKKSAKGTH